MYKNSIPKIFTIKKLIKKKSKKRNKKPTYLIYN